MQIMTHREFHHLLSSIKTLSPEQMRQLRQQLDNELASTEASQPAAAGEPPAAVPAWKQVLDNMKDLPDEEFDRMPADSSEQLDHYIYGTPKRPTT
jgi:hypothetical protein